EEELTAIVIDDHDDERERDDHGRRRTKRTGKPSRRARLALIGASILVSLGLAEVMASLVHHRAFPYLNIFEPDPLLGVRLRPNATARIRSRSGRVTEIKTNAQGFRGRDWATTPTTPTRVLLLGDSQMLGYNVDEQAALASQLESSSSTSSTTLT